MAINFPSSPTNGQTITAGGITYAYDSTQGVWSDSPQGLTQAIDALTDVDTSTSAPTNGQILEYNSSSGKFVPADSSAGVTVYATVDNLPLSGITEGSMALVDSTDKLYIFSDSGWYSIALVNATPSISGVDAAYALSSSGSATVVTVTASDPEGLPITYSIVSDTSGNAATVAQGTGSNTNQWTITPSTNSAHAGSFTLVFRASDGVNLASASSTFTLAFTIENSKYTTALITSVGANSAGNSSFDDKSSNNHSITANNDSTQITFSPYRAGGYSVYFDGTTDYLSASGAVIPTSGAFTVQCWVWLDDTSNATLWSQGSGGSSASRTSLHIENGYWGGQIGSTIVGGSGAAAPSTKQWVYTEFQYSGSQIQLFIDGSSIGTGSTSTNAENTTFRIGKLWANSYDLQGYIRDLRVISGSPSGSSSVPTEPLTAITNTELLICHLPYIADGSSNSHSFTQSGTPTIEPVSPYNVGEYSSSINGSSIHLDGSDYLTAAGTTIFDMASSSATFCIECWVYPTAFVSNSNVWRFHYIISKGAVYAGFGYDHDGKIRLYTYPDSAVTIDSSASAVKLNQWNHICCTSNSGSVVLYANGVSVGTGTLSYASGANGNAPKIGTGDTGQSADFVSGNITDLRIVDGAIPSDRSSAFTPPTVPLSAVTNTSLLLNGADAGIIDKSQSLSNLILSGPISSTTQVKYLSSSIYFDGSNDFVQFEDEMGLYGWTGDFTMEAWVYPISFQAYANPIFNYGNHGSTGNDHFNFEMSSNGTLQVRWDSATLLTSSSQVSTGAWSHVAFRRSGSTCNLYINGSSVGSATKSGALPTSSGTNRMVLGYQTYSLGSDSNRAFKGYMSDVRITKGLARTVSTPSTALKG